MTLEEAANIVELPAELHKGPHSQAYHQWVYKRLQDAIKGMKRKEEVRKALIEELRRIAEQLQAHPEYLRNPPIPGGQ
jgi:truncated hemoglobin YjbI